MFIVGESGSGSGSGRGPLRRAASGGQALRPTGTGTEKARLLTLIAESFPMAWSAWNVLCPWAWTLGWISSRTGRGRRRSRNDSGPKEGEDLTRGRPRSNVQRPTPADRETGRLEDGKWETGRLACSVAIVFPGFGLGFQETWSLGREGGGPGRTVARYKGENGAMRAQGCGLSGQVCTVNAALSHVLAAKSFAQHPNCPKYLVPPGLPSASSSTHPGLRWPVWP